MSLFTGIGFILYVIWYLAKRDQTVYLDLSTQHPDLEWKEKRNKQRKLALKVVLIVFGGMTAIGLLGMIGKAFS